MALVLLLVANGVAHASSYESIADGVIVTPDSSAAKKVRVKVIAPGVMRVTAFAQSATDIPASLMAVRPNGERVKLEARRRTAPSS